MLDLSCLPRLVSTFPVLSCHDLLKSCTSIYLSCQAVGDSLFAARDRTPRRGKRGKGGGSRQRESCRCLNRSSSKPVFHWPTSKPVFHDRFQSQPVLGTRVFDFEASQSPYGTDKNLCISPIFTIKYLVLFTLRMVPRNIYIIPGVNSRFLSRPLLGQLRRRQR